MLPLLLLLPLLLQISLPAVCEDDENDDDSDDNVCIQVQVDKGWFVAFGVIALDGSCAGVCDQV